MNKLKRNVSVVLITLMALLGTTASLAADTSQAVVGTWLVTSATGDPAHIKIYAKMVDGVETFYGKFTFFPGEDENGVNIGESALDGLNPNESLRERRLLGLDMLEGMTYNKTKARWDGGTVYDPDIGKYYKCRLSILDENRLELRGYVGIPLFGRSDIWTRL
ncbi:MAG: DUF2147 domain-containing protein [Gammaproteobacteria bacterium]|nr:DUF2147 domain-containing protein [Gammaproteobacteria bacterium]